VDDGKGPFTPTVTCDDATMKRRERASARAGGYLRGMLSTLLLTLPLVACGTARAEGAEEAMAAHAPSAFLARMDALRVEHAIPGLSVAVVRHGELILAAGLGLADVERGTPATADTPYDIASVSKPISAVVALRLVEDGAIDLDRPVAEYSAWRDFCERFAEQPSIFARDLRCDPPTHTLRHLLSHTPVGTPGEAFSYNPILYSWASRPMMAATDTPFSTLVARHVLEPAGMSDSARRHRALPLPDALAARLAPAHRVDDTGALVRAPDRPPQGDGAAGGVVSTVLELARFDLALDAGRLVSSASRATMLAPTRAPDGSTLPYGIGWYVQDHAGHRLVWHSGWWEQAYSALYLKVPEAGLTFIALANSEGIWWGNPLDGAEVERSPFAQAFLATFLPNTDDASDAE
jgi:CubicO group peptidase (beta-lactamase class C family)